MKVLMAAALALTATMGQFAPYAETHLWIRNKRDQEIPFVLNPVQRKTLGIMRDTIRAGKPRRFIALKSRQQGITTLNQAINFFTVATRPNTHVVTLAHEKDSTEDIFRIANLFYDRLSPEFQPKRLTKSNKRNLDFTELKSLFSLGTAGKKSFGRGKTLTRAHGSEVAFWPGKIKEQRSLLAGLSQAAKYGEIFLESTANGRGNLFDEVWEGSKLGANDYTRIFVPWWDDPTYRIELTDEQDAEIRRTLTDEEKDLVRKVGLDTEQIAFRRASIKELGYLFPQEYPEDDETCFLTTGICYFDTTVLVKLARTLLELPVTQIPGGFEIRWEEPIKGVEYVIGGDTSEGIPGGDPNGIGVMRRDTGAQVASVHGHFAPAVLAEIGIRYSKLYNGALLGWERNNHGHAVIQKTKDLGYGRPHFSGGCLFYHPHGDNWNSAKAGWETTPVTRPIMLNDLNDYLKSLKPGETKVRDRMFVGECLTFCKQDNERFEANSGKHDDTVFKWGIAVQMLKYRKLSSGFGWI